MLASNIHAYFRKIGLDPIYGWETLEVALDDPISDELPDERTLRNVLAESISTYLDMDADDDREGHTYFEFAVILLRSRLPLTVPEKQQILGTAVWWNTDNYRTIKTLLSDSPLLAIQDA